jgi:hypothetical protein
LIKIGKDPIDQESRFPGKLDSLDGVLVSTFSKGVLVYNGTGRVNENDTWGRGCLIVLAFLPH